MKKILSLTILLLLIINLCSCKGSINAVEETPLAKVADTSLVEKEPVFKPIQIKYANILDVEPSELKNIKLYTFVDKWLGSPYLMGGEDMNGIDCSSFAQHLYVNAYNYLVERTSVRQYEAESTSRFSGQEYLEEGDLLFFKRPNSADQTITHVGIYLKNNKFISASGYSGPENIRGVKISDLSDDWWQERFICGGRKPLPIYVEPEIDSLK
ncbi:C40 family peptidase [Mesonia phycicola]|nr:C40 family peptidase [Mesonia phycicola]